MNAECARRRPRIVVVAKRPCGWPPSRCVSPAPGRARSLSPPPRAGALLEAADVADDPASLIPVGAGGQGDGDVVGVAAAAARRKHLLGDAGVVENQRPARGQPAALVIPV